MKYTIQEGSFNAPVFMQDLSVNVLKFQAEQGQYYQMIVTRDEIVGEETLAESVERQLAFLKKQAKKFSMSEPKAITIGKKEWPAVQVEIQFAQGPQMIRQVQVVAQKSPKNLIIFALNTGDSFPPGLVEDWLSSIAKFEPS